MSLNPELLTKAFATYDGFNGGVYDSIEAAIETYLAELFKPGQLVMGEAIQPARDYRKELWSAEYANGGRDAANEALAEFDKTFPKEQP